MSLDLPNQPVMDRADNYRMTSAEPSLYDSFEAVDAEDFDAYTEDTDETSFAFIVATPPNEAVEDMPTEERRLIPVLDANGRVLRYIQE